MRRREFQRNPARPRQANKDMPGHAQRGTDWQRRPESDKETQSVRQLREAQRGTATPIEVRRSPEKPRETRKDPASSDSQTSLRGAERPDRFAKRGADNRRETQGSTETTRQAKTDRNKPRQSKRGLGVSQRGPKMFGELEKPREAQRRLERPRDESPGKAQSGSERPRKAHT